MLGSRDDEGDADRGFVPGSFEPEAVFASKFTVIGRVDDDCVVEESVTIQDGEEVTEHFVELIDARKVGGARLHRLLVSDSFQE